MRGGGWPGGRRLARGLIRLADLATQVAYRVSGGRLGARQLAYSILLLHAVGRRTGKVRTHALLYVRADDAFVVCASNYGAARHPAWYANLRANPRARIQVGRVHYDVVARTADGDEQERLWRALLGVRPRAAAA
jgi:deazaflavin-dependent oxidoreductase (nitroreductase family)